MLANLAVNDGWYTGIGGSAATAPCSSELAEAGKAPSTFGVSNASWLFESPPTEYYPPIDQPVNSTTIPAIAAGRLKLITHILRSASRLLNELIDKSVVSDLAGTEQRRGHATDEERGSEIAWGRRNTENGKYNTLAHALRVIAGRWEMGTYSGGTSATFSKTDPLCGGVSAIDLLDEAYGKDRSARVSDKSVTTPGQKAALEIVSQAGIVISPEVAVANLSTAKSAIQNQLIETAAIENGYLTAPELATFTNTGKGKAIQYVMKDITDGDLVFALKKTFNQYRILANEDESVTDVTDPGAGLSNASHVASSLSDLPLQGTALAGGIPRGDFASDVMSRVGRIQVASQCDEYGGVFGTGGDGPSDAIRVGAFQDSYAIGQTIARRLVALREDVQAGSSPAEFTEVGTLAEGAATEARAWTGPGRIFASSRLDTGDAPRVSTINLYLVGFQPADFGVSTASAMPNQIALVWGEPWVADCAARLRTSCPAGFEAAYVRTQKTVSVAQMTTTADKRSYGFDGAFLSLEFAPTASPQTNFHPEQIGGANPEKNLYVILLTDPKSPSKKGRVLGAVALRNDAPTGGTSVGFSYKQWDQFNHLLGPPPKWREPVAIGQPGTSTGPGHCIEGVAKDFFVPLENELTSDSDGYENSWRHYLNLAKEAAARADELGQNLIDLGLQQEYRTEAANEDLAAICGDFGAAGKIEMVDGNVTPPDDDQNLANCLGEDAYDIVLLTHDPTKGMSGTARKDFVHDDLHACDDEPESELCQANTIGEEQIAGLGLEPYQPPPDPQTLPDLCLSTIELAHSNQTGFQGQTLKTLANSAYLNPAQLAGLAARFRLEVLPSGVWNLYVAGEKKMSANLAAPTDFWPDCRKDGAPACESAPEASLFDLLFRRLNTSDLRLGFAAGHGGLSDAQAEVNAILWRVQGALWMIGAMSGSIPQGMFDIQVPAANFNGSYWHLDDPNPHHAPIFTVFGAGRFTGTALDASTDLDEDRAALGEATAIPATMGWPQEAVSVYWLRDIYLPPLGQPLPTNKYVHVHGVNPEIANVGPPDVGAFLDSVGTKLDGLKCFDSYVNATKLAGDGQPYTAASSAGRDLVESARRGSSWGTLCKNNDGDTIVKLNVVPGLPGLASSSILDLFSYEAGYSSYDSAWENAKKHIPLFPLQSIDNQLDGRTTKHYGAEDGLSSNTQSNIDVMPGACRHLRKQGATVVDTSTAGLQYIQGTSNSESGDHCASNGSWSDGGYDNHIRYTQRMLLPRVCSADERVQAFVNSYPPNGTCAAAAQVTQAVALACHIDKGDGATSLEPPVLKKIEDLDGFVKWIGRLELESRLQISRIYLEKLPKRIVDDFTKQTVGAGTYKGEHGEIVAELRGGLQQLYDGWIEVHGRLGELRNSVDAARLSIIEADIASDTAVAQLALQKMSIHAGMISAASSLLSNPLGGVGQFVNAPAQIQNGEDMLDKVEELEEYTNDEKHNSIAQILNNLELATGPMYTGLSGGLSKIVSASATVTGIQAKLAQSQETAKYQAAKAANADYYYDSTGQVVKIPVNTVNRRMYDLTKKRYEDALRDAKYLAYVARLAIEQRIGIRLLTIDTPVGVLEEPALWAEDICSLQGVDFEKLKEFYVADPNSPVAFAADIFNLMAESSDKFVGDYVAKLENFVEYYNIQYPSHDGDDTTVLSLRDDLLGHSKSCVVPGPNLLYYSGSLTSLDSLEEEQVVRGWVTDACNSTDDKCLRVEPPAVLPDPPELPPEAQIGGFSWLHDAAAPPPYDGGTPDAGDAGEGGIEDAATAPPASSSPPRTVSQVLTLEAGASYVLSWWDQGRDASGEYTTQTPPDYLVAVLAPDGQQVVEFTGAPFMPALSGGLPSGQVWSDRNANALHFTATEAGEYRMVFAASAAPDAASLGSVVIANVQLEVGPPGSLPSGYANTGSSLLQIASQCGGSTPAELQNAFKYACDKNGDCFYELVAPFVIDTTDVSSSNLAGKLAAGNFNFRHIDVALNLVGTGVYDCTANPSASCFSNAFVEYTLDHDAFQVGVLNHSQEVQVFNFGLAGINHAKALAAERYITLPIGDADKSLLTQPGITKPEYRGRPLDGSYRLRIWDSPYLAWNRLEDVQIVLQYRYWSKIAEQAPSN